MRIATANLEYGMSEAELTRAGRIIRRKGIGIVGFQELRDVEDRMAVQRGLSMRVFGWHAGGQCPQAYRGRWRVVESEVVSRATTGLEGVTPDLPITRVVYVDKRRPARTFVVYNTHLVPLSLHGKRRTDHSQWRQVAWDQHWADLCAMVDEDVIARRTVFVMGDFNNVFATDAQAMQLHPTARWLVRTPLDWLIVVEGNVRVRKIRGLSFATGSDHRAVGAQVLLTVKR